MLLLWQDWTHQKRLPNEVSSKMLFNTKQNQDYTNTKFRFMLTQNPRFRLTAQPPRYTPRLRAEVTCYKADQRSIAICTDGTYKEVTVSKMDYSPKLWMIPLKYAMDTAKNAIPYDATPNDEAKKKTNPSTMTSLTIFGVLMPVMSKFRQKIDNASPLLSRPGNDNQHLNAQERSLQSTQISPRRLDDDTWTQRSHQKQINDNHLPVSNSQKIIPKIVH